MPAYRRAFGLVSALGLPRVGLNIRNVTPPSSPPPWLWLVGTWRCSLSPDDPRCVSVVILFRRQYHPCIHHCASSGGECHFPSPNRMWRLVCENRAHTANGMDICDLRNCTSSASYSSSSSFRLATPRRPYERIIRHRVAHIPGSMASLTMCSWKVCTT